MCLVGTNKERASLWKPLRLLCLSRHDLKETVYGINIDEICREIFKL